MCVTSLEISESHQISIFYYDELLFIKYHFQWHFINWTCYRHSFDVLIKWYTIRNIKKNHQHDKTIWKRCANAILCTMRVIKYLHWHFAEPQNKCRWQWYSVCVCAFWFCSNVSNVNWIEDSLSVDVWVHNVNRI